MSAMVESPASGNAACVDLDRVLKLFCGPNSAHMFERHVSAIERLCRSNAGGFAIRDLPKAQQVLELTLQLLHRGNEKFLQPALNLLRTLAQPFVRRTSTDEFKMLSSITGMLSAIAVALEEPYNVHIKLASVQALLQFSTAYGYQPGSAELSTAVMSSTPGGLGSGTPARQYHTNQSLIGRSTAIRSTVHGLAAAILACDTVLVQPLTQLLLSFSRLPDNCSRLVEAGALQCLPPLLSYNFHASITFIAVELLWNLVEYSPEATAMLGGQLPFLEEILQPASSAPEPPPVDPSPLVAVDEVASQGGDDVCSSESTATPVWALALTPPPEQQAPLSSSFLPPGIPPPPDYAASTASESGRSHLDHMRSDLPSPPWPSFSESASARPSETMSSINTPRLAHGRASFAHGTWNATTASETSELELIPTQTVGGPSVPPDSVVARLAAALTTLLQATLLKGHRTLDKELRNDVLVASTLLLRSRAFVLAASQLGFFDCILAAATSPELGDRPTYVKPFALTVEEPDLELRLLAWSAVAAGAAALPAVLRQASDAGFLRVLLMYITIHGKGASAATYQIPSVARWGADQLAALRTAALSKLHVLAPLLVPQFRGEGGPALMVQFLGSCTSHGHLEAALRHLRRLALEIPVMRDVLGAQGAIPVLLALVSNRQQLQEGVRHFALMLLATMCTEQTENKRRFRKANGVQVLLTQLRALREVDSTLPSAYAVAVLDAIWSCIVPDKKSAARFLVGGGMDWLLDLLERGNQATRPVVLSVLADIVENPKSHTFVHAWRSDITKQCVGKLLLRFWREEDSLRGMTLAGVLANTSRPLGGSGKRTAWLAAETVTYGNLAPERKNALQAVLEGVSGDVLLSKLYAVLKLLGFDVFGHLPQEDQAALIMVEKYVKFRQGEIWQQINADFGADGMEPTELDRERLASGIELSEHLATAVRESQLAMLGRQGEALKVHEATFFDAMRSQRRAEAEARHYVHDRSALTIAELRDAKQRKEAMLKASVRDFRTFSNSSDGNDGQEIVVEDVEASSK